MLIFWMNYSSVVDIWSLHPQPHLQPKATLHSPVSSLPPHEAGRFSPPLTTTNAAATTTLPPTVTTTTTTTDTDTAPEMVTAHSNKPGTVPKHWGEVVINPKKKRSRPGLNTRDGSRDVFGVLKVP